MTPGPPKREERSRAARSHASLEARCGGPQGCHAAPSLFHSTPAVPSSFTPQGG